jgi:hypothetical protein
MRCGASRERGSITAEFAASLPAVVLVLAFCLAGMQLGAQHLRLQDAAATAARSAGRGDPVGLVSTLVPGATLRVANRGDLVCVTAAAHGAGTGAVGFLAAVSVSASSCALGGGR